MAAMTGGFAMQMVLEQVRGVRILVTVNWDMIFSVGTVIVGLLAGAFLGQALLLP
jgi:hypothetical protein